MAGDTTALRPLDRGPHDALPVEAPASLGELVGGPARPSAPPLPHLPAAAAGLIQRVRKVDAVQLFPAVVLTVSGRGGHTIAALRRGYLLRSGQNGRSQGCATHPPEACDGVDNDCDGGLMATQTCTDASGTLNAQQLPFRGRVIEPTTSAWVDVYRWQGTTSASCCTRATTIAGRDRRAQFKTTAALRFQSTSRMMST